MEKKPNYRNQSGVDEVRSSLGKLDPQEMQAFFARRARAENTQATYASAQRRYLAWCEARGEVAIPGTPDLVAGYLVYLAMERELKASTVRTNFAGIARYYRDMCGIENVTRSDHVRNVLSGIQRTLIEREVQAKALTADLIGKVVLASFEGAKANGPKAKRDRAILLVGFACAFRRSELASLRVDDLTWESRGATIMLRSSKTDQRGAGRVVGMHKGRGRLCPCNALRAWLEACPSRDWIFRPITKAGKVAPARMTDKSVGLVVKRMVEAAGIDPDGFSAHSLRAGMTTDLVTAGLSVAQVKRRTRHASDGMVSRYLRPASELDTNFTRAAFTAHNRRNTP